MTKDQAKAFVNEVLSDFKGTPDSLIKATHMDTRLKQIFRTFAEGGFTVLNAGMVLRGIDVEFSEENGLIYIMVY